MRNRIKQFKRLLDIYSILAYHNIDKLILKYQRSPLLRIFILCHPLGWRKRTKEPSAIAIRLAFEKLGPIFVKFGQTLSTRRDLLAVDIADELSKLQDQVPPFSGVEAKKFIEKEYKQPVENIFSDFNIVPLASASIAQIHQATLLNGKEVVIKILRPTIKKRIKEDIALLYFLANLAMRYWKKGKRFKPVQIVAEFEESILGELDLMREAANASQLRRNFHFSPLLYVPEIYWPYTHNNAIVMERIHGIPIRNIAQLKKHNVNLKRLAERGIEIFFTQVFRDSFFHADMHPGNIFVAHENPQEPRYIVVDFGIMGMLSPQDKRYIAENFLAFFRRDYRRVAILHVESGWAPPNTRIDLFETAIRTICEPNFEKPLAEISFGEMLMRLFQMAGRFNIEIQPQLILLQKTLLNIEGLGRQLYPELDLWKTAKPFLERWIRQEIGPRAFLRKVREYAPIWLEQLPEVPLLIYRNLQEVKSKSAQPTETHILINRQQYQKQYFLLGFLVATIISSLIVLLLLHL